jgi:short-subunit dehydrogenase
MDPKLVLVTGASSGIGEATAKRYGRGGANVLLLARNVERLAAVADAIRRDGGTASVYPVDLADAAAVEEVSARIALEAGTPDILINNAGVGRWLPLIETSADEALGMIEVPYLAGLNLTRAFLPRMLARRSGTIAYITSPASYLAWPNASAYIAARRAVAGLAESLRSELHGSGITVTLVVLGAVESPYWQHNPGSRANLPETNSFFFPVMSVDEAARTIDVAVESKRRVLVRPWLFRLLFVLNVLMPNLVAAQLRSASRKARRRNRQG